MAQGNYSSTGDFRGPAQKQRSNKGKSRIGSTSLSQAAVSGTSRKAPPKSTRSRKKVGPATSISSDPPAASPRIQADAFSPSKRANAGDDKPKALSAKLASFGAGLPAGSGPFGKALKGGVSGAAIGASIDEFRAEKKAAAAKAKAKKKKPGES